MKGIKQKNSFISVLPLMALAFLCITSCETTFEPLQENDRYHFSIFGALDLSADTQWVRVMPITDSIFVNSDKPIDVEVTLTRLSTGDTIAMKDSLLQYSNSIYAWNFYTTTPLHASESYELKAEASDGRFSSATVTIPPDFPMPVVDYSDSTETGDITGTGIERLVVADIIYTVQIMNPCELTEGAIQEVAISYLEGATVTITGLFRVFIDGTSGVSSALRLVPCDTIIYFDREVLLVSGDEYWPDYEGQSEDEIYFPEVNSNVEDGLGVLTGIVSKRFPLESCFDEEGENIACPPVD